MVRVLASHQCGLGSIPIHGVICGLSLLFTDLAPIYAAISVAGSTAIAIARANAPFIDGDFSLLRFYCFRSYST